jgi:glycosyltransferase involved in cell wall biosynthesis
MKNVLFYSDSKECGGHEIQTISAIGYLQNHFKIHFVVSKENKYFVSLLKQWDINVICANYSSTRYQIVRSLISLRHAIYLRKIIRDISPEIIINIQGNIEIGSIMLLIAKGLSIRCISYIPCCHYLKTVSNKGFVSVIKDFINTRYYQFPTSFITINEYNGELIYKRNKNAPITVVENGIDFKKFEILDKQKARCELDFKKTIKYIGLIGRVSFFTKGHDILLKMVDKYRSELKSYRFVIVGVGEDTELLTSRIKEKEVEDYFLLLGHHSNLSVIYSAIDGIVIPSRYEGTPLVLLEALYYKLPIVMTNLPGVGDYLKKTSLFKKEDIDDFFEAFCRTISVCVNSSLVLDIVDKHSIVKFQENFFQAVLRSIKRV